MSFKYAIAMLGLAGTAYAFDAAAVIEGFSPVYLAIGLGSVVFLAYLAKPKDEWRGGATGILKNEHTMLSKDKVEGSYDVYEGMFGKDSRKATDAHDSLLKKRQANYTTMVNNFYDLVTDFYEWGWGDMFHFGPRFIGEDFHESLRRAEYYLCSRLGMDATKHAVDIGCGVGGPMRNMARFSGAKITGVNNNDYQIKVGGYHNKRKGLDHLCGFLKADFMHIPVADATFDCAYAIEATCHAPDKAACFAEVFRVLKPGGTYAGYDWCVTPKYDSKNDRHRTIKQGIEVGNSLPTLATQQEVVDALVKAGFEVIDSYDAERGVHSPHEIPWYHTLTGQYTLKGFRMTALGRTCTHLLVSTLEFLRIAPKGSTKVSSLLNATAIDLVDGGKLEIFTPSFFFLARKPGY